VTWADQLYPSYRATIEDVFGAKVIDTYGCAEGMQVAAQCPHGSYHFQMLDTIVEFLDEHDHPVPAGTPGRIVLTRLIPGAMPFLRYDVGDIGVATGDIDCACGRQWELMESVEGRLTDVIVSPAGNRYVAHFFALCLEEFPQIVEYQIEQTGPSRIVIHVVSPGAPSYFDRQIAQRLQALGLTDMEIHVDRCASIPPSKAGKRRWVIGLNQPPQIVPLNLPAAKPVLSVHSH
jgi:phenylacetate-CoA ligase